MSKELNNKCDLNVRLIMIIFFFFFHMVIDLFTIVRTQALISYTSATEIKLNIIKGKLDSI